MPVPLKSQPHAATAKDIRRGVVFFFPGRPEGAPVYECLRRGKRRVRCRRVWPDLHSDVSTLEFPTETPIVVVR